MLQLFLGGGPIMWPLLLTSIVALSVVFDRIFFFVKVSRGRDPRAVQKVFELVEKGDLDGALECTKDSNDYVTAVLRYGLAHRNDSLAHALLRQASIELKSFNRGLSTLDTVITLAPLLGLLGTVIGMISAFNFIGGQQLGAPTEITGGIAEALLATAFGLGIAITALIPFNFLNSRLEDARHEIEDAASRLELLLKRV